MLAGGHQEGLRLAAPQALHAGSAACRGGRDRASADKPSRPSACRRRPTVLGAASARDAEPALLAMGGAVVDEGPTGIKAPDGGWGWAVLWGCFVITGFSYAFPKAVSVFFKELMREFGIGYSDTAWVSSILLAMLYGTGPLCSVCVNRFGCRPVMLAGGLLASLGMVSASFCGSIVQLYLTTGVITGERGPRERAEGGDRASGGGQRGAPAGPPPVQPSPAPLLPGLGLALNFQPSLIMLNRYFNKRRPMANGLAAAGSPVFLCALSPLGQLLQDHYGWRGGFLILGGLLLNCCVCAALMRPLEAPGGGQGPGPQRPARRLLDLSVFRDRGFVIYAVAASVMVLGLFVPPVFVVSYAKDLGVPDTRAAFLLTVLGFIDIFARPTAGFVAGLKRVRPYSVYLFSFAMFFNGFTDLTGSTAGDYGGLVVFCIFFGISYGMVGALQFEVLMAIVGTQQFSSAIGLVLLLEAVAVLIGPPSGGECRAGRLAAARPAGVGRERGLAPAPGATCLVPGGGGRGPGPEEGRAGDRRWRRGGVLALPGCPRTQLWVCGLPCPAVSRLLLHPGPSGSPLRQRSGA
uniref:Solute carrier family 16 member 3 n=1 Tax=Sus scrofa TaxID=9823 RepID=A0A4X1U2F0_PIG